MPDPAPYNATIIGWLRALFLLSLVVTLTAWADNSTAPPPPALHRGTARLTLNTHGRATQLRARRVRLEALGEAPAGQIVVGSDPYALQQPVVHPLGAAAVRLEYAVPSHPPLIVSVEHRLLSVARGTLYRRLIALQSPGEVTNEVAVQLSLAPFALADATWLPLKNGVGGCLGASNAAAYDFAGVLPAEGVSLALPLVSYQAGGRVTIMTDPLYSTLFSRDAVAWKYPGTIGLEGGRETRVLDVLLHPGGAEEALAAFFASDFIGVQPGPDWLRDIALVDYDYLSDGGRGWYRDIDALTAALKPSERRRVFLCLHGWYDFVGRYCFDAQTRRLDPEWLAFSNHPNVKGPRPPMNLEGVAVDVSFEKCVPVALSLEKLHRRLQYARSRGFRAGLYFADGLNAGEGLGYSTNRILRWGGWEGPDTKGKTYCQNPLAPEVREFYLRYAGALLQEFGRDLDALVWDETFHVEAASIARNPRGHAGRAMMTLVRDVTRQVDDYNRAQRRQIALLASDDIGAWGGIRNAPYAVMAHGTYQDSHCRPDAWPFAIFPNYRTAFWSCCWWPVSRWDWVAYGVRQYHVPVSISNGWGDNLGFAEISPAMQQKVLDLFRWRLQHHTRLHWLDRLPPLP